MADLVARGRKAENCWRRALGEGQVTLGRLAAKDTWDVPWDGQVSRQHATLTWGPGGLTVCRMSGSRNPVFFRGEDQGFDAFSVAPGETFVIGNTAFTVEDGEAKPNAQLTVSQQTLRQIKYIDADERIEVLASLPEVIRLSSSDQELEGRVAEVLLRGIPRAGATAIVRLHPGEASCEPEVEVRALATRDQLRERVRPSRRLIADAVKRRQSVFYRWDVKAPQQDFTVDAAFDWALCAPLPDEPAPGWGLYATGRSQTAALLHAGRSQEEVFTSDLKFAEVVGEIFASLRQVRELQAEKLQMLTSLRVAQEVQAGFFPRSLPDVPGYELAASSRSAEATGGDYYDVIVLPSGRLGLVVADVCGHGLGPSLLMASVRAMLRGFAVREPDPEQLLTDLGQAQYDDLVPRRRFITLLYGTLSPAEHRFCYANAGHGPVALHLQPGRGRVGSLVDDDARGCPLGILKESYQPCTPVALEPGDLLVLGSDGVVETRRGGESYGVERLTDFILQRKDQPLPQLLDEVMEATTAFHERARPDDDLTLMLVRRQ